MADTPMVLVPQTAEDVKARFGLDPDATGNRPRGWRIVDEGESRDIRAFNGTDIPAGSLAVHTRDGAANPICPEACRLPNFIGTLEDDFDRTYRDYFYAPLPPAPSTTSTAEQVETSEASAPTPEQIAEFRKWFQPVAPSPGEGEAPVAWRYRWVEGRRTGKWFYQGHMPDHLGDEGEVEPLYTRPTPATPEGLRIAVEALKRISRMEGWTERDGGQSLSDAVSAAEQALSALQPQAQGGE